MVDLMTNKVLEEVKQKLSCNKKAIFFDMFDTLVMRDIHPEDIKKVSAKNLIIKFGLDIKMNDLYDIRSKLEIQLCEGNNKKNGNLEFNIYELAEYIFNEIKPQIPKSLFIHSFVETEIFVEKKRQSIYSDLKVVLDYLSNLDIKLYVLSDFYIPSDGLKQILEHHGLLKYFTNVFSSSDELVTKRTGTLYDLTLKKLNLSADEIIMIGDNEHSDYNIPASKGILAIKIDRKEMFEKYNSYKKDNCLNKAISSSYKNFKSPLFKSMPITLYLYFEQLYIKLNKDKISDVFFLAREGQSLIELFEHYQSSISAKNKIKAHYFYTSRRSSFLPSLNSLDKEDFETLFRQYVYITPREFFQNLGMSETEIVTINESCLLSLDIKNNNFRESVEYQSIRNNEVFQQIYEANRVSQKSNFLSYVDSFGADLQNSPMVLVDVGWKGTIQDHIHKIMNNICTVKGYYFGLLANGDISETNTKEGLLFDINMQSKFGIRVFAENTALFEVLLAANHGSALRYEQSSESEFYTLDKFHEKEQFDNVISPILDLIKKDFVCLVNTLTKISYDNDQIITNTVVRHSDMVLSPSLKEMDWFKKIYHIENFGIFDKSEVKKETVSIMMRIDTIKQVLFDRKTFVGSNMWPRAAFYYKGIDWLGKIYAYKIRRNSGI